MFIPNIWLKLLVLATAIALNIPSSTCEASNIMNEHKTGASDFDYMSAFRYVAAWASFDNDDVTELSRNPKEFHGHLGSLDFFYSEEIHVLHVWAFVTPGSGPLLTTRAEVKQSIDRIARENPHETAGGVFDIRTLDWNKQVTAKLEPCLWLRADILDAKMPVKDMVKRLNDLSTAGYVWHREKMSRILDAYWQAHPKTEK